MAKKKKKPISRKDTLETLRFFTNVTSAIMRKPMTPSHQDAIAHYAAKKLPKAALANLHSKSGTGTALAFIARTLEEPPHLHR